eukprot:TRINITY_DN8139_c0_g1_i3.p1 TRINITY_DN8139_c0_g1~~TRINITY_DN8139_c0_g1_i3.p1  ORF type:complete len:177 (-),score=19.39 TRINITY_DN8139_c0_g1_i3:51-581(-)
MEEDVGTLSQGLVDRLQLKVWKHHRPYFVRWLMLGDEVQIQYACPITFSVGEDYTNTVLCNVLPIDSCDILLGRPWMYDKNDTNGMRDNTYTFMHGEKQVTLRPMKPAPPKKGSSSRLTKEVLQVHTIYKINIKKKSRVRGRTLFQPGVNDAAAPIFDVRYIVGHMWGPLMFKSFY